jgi:hypothetical protein
MDESQTVAILNRLLTAAQDNGPDEKYQKAAIDYYYGRPRGDEQAGRSQVQSLDVADMVHAVMSQILPSFTQDTVCQFEPDGPDDEAKARLESDAVNRVMMESSRGYVVLYEAVKDALLLKNGIIKVWLDDSQGQRRVRIGAVDPIAFHVADSQGCVLLDDYETSFCAERKEYTRGELVGMGFDRDKVDRLPTSSGQDTEATDVRRKGGYLSTEQDAGWANECVPVFEGYARLPDDLEGSETKLYRCLFGGQILLSQEEVEFIPYAAGSPFPEPHRFWGLSLFDRLKTVQDTKTAIKRQWVDSLANCNNSRAVINDRINIDDATDSRPGGLVRVQGTGPVQDSIMPLPMIDAGPAAASFLAYEDQVRSDRGGAALQMASAESQLTQGAVGSQGVDRIFSVQEQLSGMIARTLAETLLRSAFMLVHRVLREEYREPLTLRLADQWVQVDPAQWPERARVNIRSGLSPGERSRKAAAMTAVLQYQIQALQMGMDGVLVTLPNLYNGLLDWMSAQELDAGEKYFTDPRSQTAQAGSQQKMQQGQQQQAMQMQMMQMQVQLEQAKLQLDKYKADQDNQLKAWTERLHAEIEEAKIIGSATADLQRVELEGRFRAASPAPGNGAAGAG